MSVRSAPPAGAAAATGRLATGLRSAAVGLLVVGVLVQGCALPYGALPPGASGALPPAGSVDAPLNQARQRVPVVVRPPAGEDRTVLLASSRV